MIIKTEQEFIESYLKDASNLKGEADKVYIPNNEDEIKESIIECFNNQTNLTFAGAGTGLTGSRVPLGGAVLSTELLNKIIKIDKEEKIAVIQPGVIFTDLEIEFNQLNLFYPPNPTERNSSLGGNVSTNASGARTFKYGSTRNFIKALKIILSNGDELFLERGKIFESNGFLEIKSINNNIYKIPIQDINMPKVKHAAGYFIKPGMDAIDLFIGSEGTLGCISEITLSLLEQPEKYLAAVVFFDKELELLNFTDYVRKQSLKRNNFDYRTTTEICSRIIEFFDSASLDYLRDDFPQIPKQAVAAVWIEQEYASENELTIMNNWYSLIKEYTSLADQTWTAVNDNEFELLKNFRHALPQKIIDDIAKFNIRKVGTDTAVPANSFRDFYFAKKNLFLELGLPYNMYGHIGNCHLHSNAMPRNPEQFQKALLFISKMIDRTIELAGTVSAEHGIGKIKKEYFKKMYGDSIINYMKNIKSILDTTNIFGNGTLF